MNIKFVVTFSIDVYNRYFGAFVSFIENFNYIIQVADNSIVIVGIEYWDKIPFAIPNTHNLNTDFRYELLKVELSAT